MQQPKLKRIIPFSWYGGKYSHLDWLLPKLPECYHYCEPFSGSGSVLLNRSPSAIETYNDLDGELVNFFRVLRDDGNRLITLIKLTPQSRDEFNLSLSDVSSLSEIERARLFYVRARQVRGATVQMASAQWKYSIGDGGGDSNAYWRSRMNGLYDVAKRLLRVQIENSPAEEVIQRYDSPKTLFYCDPPYVHDTRAESNAYGDYEMKDEQHTKLAGVLNSAVGKVAISNYDCELMERLYPAPKWHKIVGPSKSVATSRRENSTNRTECLWVNYQIVKSGLFGDI